MSYPSPSLRDSLWIRRRRLASASLVLLSFLLGCAKPAAADVEDLRSAFRRPPDLEPAAAGEQDEQKAARIALGRALFFDPRLSLSDDISCASCHDPALGWGDGLARGTGHGQKQLARRTPTILNLAWSELLMWDGRFASLEEQALAPIAAAEEMAMPLADLVPKLQGIPGYLPMFEAAFEDGAITLENLAAAIAAFERTVVSGPAPFDAWLGGDESAISADAKRGFSLFAGELGCGRCHSGWRFTDDSFHDIGVTGEDRGRGVHFEEIEALQNAFKTPTLRDVARRAPYMHDGSEGTLADVIDLYDRGGRVRRPSLSPEIRPLHMDERQKRDLLAFLETLTSESAPLSPPSLPR